MMWSGCPYNITSPSLCVIVEKLSKAVIIRVQLYEAVLHPKAQYDPGNREDSAAQQTTRAGDCTLPCD